MITNVGGGYDPQNGIFTCPSEGEYVFIWTVMGGYVGGGSGSSGDNCDAYIYRNGASSLMTYSHEESGSGYESATNTVMFHLNIGDTVWIQTGYCRYFHGYPTTAFSGWKL